MTFELLSGLSGSWSDLLAVLATTLSGSALYTAFRMSEQMRRRVDGELGELPPNFALYPAPRPSCRRPTRRISSSASTTITGGRSG